VPVEATSSHTVLTQSSVSIRAYGLEDHVRSESIRCTDRYSRAARTFNTVDKWASVRMDAIGTVFILGLTTYLVYGPQGANPSEIGFSLDMAFGFARLILWLVININETQSTSENCDEGRR
jgi:ABC-type multidrug transport system fused ATPase/permease subunit